MSKRQIIMLFGAIIILVALLSGLPTLWNTIIYVASGVLIVGCAYLMKPVGKAEDVSAAPYAEHVPPVPEQPKDPSQNPS